MSTHVLHAARAKRTLTAELLLVTEIQLFILLAKLPPNQELTLWLDGALIFAGVFATAFLVARRAGGWWFLLCGVAPVLAGIAQLFVSFGAERSFLVFVTVLIAADMVANLILLGIAALKGRPPWPR